MAEGGVTHQDVLTKRLTPLTFSPTNTQIVRMHEAALAAQVHAYAPYSHFAVGAALLLSDGEIITGCNVENASYGLTICAERTAVSRAVAIGRQDFVAIALVTNAEQPTRPCGACRQVLAEFSSPDSPLVVICFGKYGEAVQETICELLPNSFSLTSDSNLPK